MARTRLQLYFLATGVVLLAIAGSLGCRILQGDIPFTDSTNHGYLTYTFWIPTTGTVLLLASICIHISLLTASKSHTVKTILVAYIINLAMKYISVFMRRKLDSKTKDPRREQEALLTERITRDADTLYGKRNDLKNIKTLKDLQRLHPITDYEHYAEYVEKMADGEEGVLTRAPLVRFGITSGTTGKGKLIPLVKPNKDIEALVQLVFCNAAAQRYGWYSPAQKELMIYVNPKPFKTPSGHLVGPMFLFTDNLRPILQAILNPVWETSYITTEFEATYLSLLFGLRDKNIHRFFGPFSSMTHKSMGILEKNWERIVKDITEGTIDATLEITDEVRNASLKALSPDPERGQELREEFQKGFDGIMRRVWPEMRYIFGIETSDYTEKLINGYARGIPIFSPMYGSTEGYYGINLWPGELDRYTLIPHSVIYEFIPENEMSEEKPATLLIDEVEKGQRYEMIVSTTGGFYRYRFGDVIQVVDFYNATPVVRFLYRSGQLLNLRSEKLTEVSVKEAVYHVASHWTNARIAQWTSAESTVLAKLPDIKDEFDVALQFYVIFIELEGDTDNAKLDENLQQKFDDSLRDANNYYRGYRSMGTISRPYLYLVKPGTFKLLQDFIIAKTTASYNQYKVPRKLKTADTLKLMLSARV